MNANNLQKRIIEKLAHADKQQSIKTFLELYKTAQNENEKQQIFKIAKALKLF